MKEYKYKGEAFQLDDSKGCYVAVTYKHLDRVCGGESWNKRDGPVSVCLEHR